MPLESGIQSPFLDDLEVDKFVSVDATWEWHPISLVGKTIREIKNEFQLMPLESGIQSSERDTISHHTQIVSVDATWEWHPIPKRDNNNPGTQVFQLMPLESGIQSCNTTRRHFAQAVSVDATWEWHPIFMKLRSFSLLLLLFQLMPLESGIQSHQLGEWSRFIQN